MNLPTGTVTFLFTDIEGSTRLAQQHRESWETIRARHHAILRGAIEAHGGYVFQVVGDAFCAAFSTAGEAVLAAVQIQVNLNDEAWLEDATVKVRAGIHTGTAMIQPDGEYQGYLAMSHTQRLFSAAHGGQVLVSLASQELVRDHLPEGVRLRDMGTHRLKDIAQPEHIYQLVIPGLAADLPPINTLERTGSHSTARLTVRMLGTFEVTLDGKPVGFAGRIAQSLFCYLILHPGAPHRREKLAGMFWPDVTEAKARTYLRHELWSIRKSLSAEDKQDFLITDDIAVSFNLTSDCWLDVIALENVKESASAEDLMDALALYRGDFLPGFYEEWITLEREHLQAVYEKRMTKLLDLLEKERLWKETLEWAERWISLGQGPEAAYRALMIAYDGLGEPAKVAATYRRCVEALHEQDLEPSEQIRTLAFKRTARLHIPVPLTSFIGREKELDTVAALISDSRLVTLTGSGGVGKTRLAIQVVADILESFPDGVWFLDLAPVMDPALVPHTLAGVLDLQLMGGQDVSYTDLVIGYLRWRRTLIIFDNCEHLIEACAGLAHALLTSCEHLSILATSREALRVSGEVRYRVPSLDIPDLDIASLVESLRRTESVRLFTERASMAGAGFVIGPQNALTIAKICQRLDGIPLAIELAAARVHVLGVEQVLRRLDDRFNLLTSGSRSALPRHQTLRAAIEWSYDILSEKERLLFQRLAVFIGGWTLEAAEAICSGEGIGAGEVLDLLSHLVDKSLVLVDTSQEETRYRRLETIRQFACEKLTASGEEQYFRDRHLGHFLKLAQKAELEIHSTKVIEWVDRLEKEQENLRAALEWSLESNVKAGPKLAIALRWWWERNGPNSGGYEWIQKMLSITLEDQPLIRAKLFDAAGSLYMAPRDEQAIFYTQESLALFRQLGNKEGMASALFVMAMRAYFRSDYEQAAELFEQSCTLSRDAGINWGLAGSLCGLGVIAQAQGNLKQAQELFEESLLLSREIGDPGATGFALFQLGSLAVSRGDNANAMILLTESLQIARAFKQKIAIGLRLNGLGSTAIASGEYESGKKLLKEAIELYEKMGNPGGMAYSLQYLAWASLLQGDYVQARSLYLETIKLMSPLDAERYLAEYLLGVGQLMAAQGNLQTFAHLMGMAARAAPDYHSLLVPQLFITETDKYIELARAKLGDQTYTAAWHGGHELSLQESIHQVARYLQ